MPVSRRQFLASSAVAAGMAACGPPPSDDRAAAPAAGAAGGPTTDPLGVRADFPVASERTYLNAAYITPVPREVVTAGQAFVERKATRPISLGDMLKQTDEVRAQTRG